MTNWQAFQNPEERRFIGLDNYIRLINDPVFQASLVNTFKYAVIYMALSILLALLCPLAINAAGRLAGFFRTVYFLPVVTSAIATALIWSVGFYQPRYCLFNQVFALAGLPQQPFLRSPATALFSVIIYAVWKNLGYDIVIFMAGLSAIPSTFYEAARVDGATVEALMLDARIIRNRAKIEATISNARVTLEMHEGELDELVWSFAPPAGRRRPNSLGDIPAVTTESTALSKTLRSRGFRFVGPTTMYALMQSAGLVDDHVVGCHRAD